MGEHLVMVLCHISLLTLKVLKKQMTRFMSANLQKMLGPSYIKLRIQRLDSKQCRS